MSRCSRQKIVMLYLIWTQERRERDRTFKLVGDHKLRGVKKSRKRKLENGERLPKTVRFHLSSILIKFRVRKNIIYFFHPSFYRYCFRNPLARRASLHKYEKKYLSSFATPEFFYCIFILARAWFSQLTVSY